MASTNSPRQSPYSAEQVEELRRYNATLRPAGASRSRPGQGLNRRGGNAINRGFGASASSMAAPNLSSKSQHGPTMLGNRVVGSAITSRGAHALGRPTHASPPATSNAWANVVLAGNDQPVFSAWPASAPTGKSKPPFTSAFTSPSSTHQLSESATFETPVTATSQTPTPFLGSSVPPHLRGSGNTLGAAAGLGSGSSSIAPLFPDSSVSSAVEQANATQSAGVSSRQRIVTNWGPDPVGPQIPAHLQQRSASNTIAEIAQIMGVSYNELTTDGVSIPAPGPDSTHQQSRTALGDTFIEMGAPRVETSVDSTVWMQPANKFKRRHTSSEMDVDEDSVVPVATGSASRTTTLQDSARADSTWTLPVNKPAPTEVAFRTSSVRAVAAVGNSENSRLSVTIAGSKDSVYADQPVFTHRTAPLQSVSNGWSSAQVPASTLLSHAHTSYNANPLHQVSNQFRPDTSIGLQNVSFTPNPLGRASNTLANPTPATSGFAGDAVTSPFTSSSVVAPAASSTATRRQPMASKKTLKDSMWAS